MPFGEIKSIDLPFKTPSSPPPTFALIEFEDPDDCDHAIFNMNNSMLNGRTIQVHFARQAQIAIVRGQKPIWQTDEYKRTVTDEP